MEKERLTVSLLLRQQRCTMRLIVYILLASAGIGISLIQLLSTRELNAAVIFVNVLGIGLLGIGFGVMVGLRGVIRTVREIRRIRNLHFTIGKGVLVNKKRHRRDSSDRYCTLYFEDGQCNVSEWEYDTAEIGDTYYFLIYDGEDYASGIYNTKQYELDKKLMERMK